MRAVLFQILQQNGPQVSHEVLLLAHHCNYPLLQAVVVFVELRPADRTLFLLLLDYVLLRASRAKTMLSYCKRTKQGSIIEGALSKQIQHSLSVYAPGVGVSADFALLRKCFMVSCER